MVKILIVDQSSLVRQMLTEILTSANDMDVVGVARDAHDARRKIKKLKPDVLTLDVQLPGMDGLTFLSNMMRLHPMPVVMISALTIKGSDMTLAALSLGALDYICKPSALGRGLDQYREEIIIKVRKAGCAVDHVLPLKQQQPHANQAIDMILAKITARQSFKVTEKIIAIGASLGAIQEVSEVLTSLPADNAPMVLSQHLPDAFTVSYVQRLNRASAATIQLAEHGQTLRTGHVYIAPGHSHLLVIYDGERYICHLDHSDRVHKHRPSLDVMFRSVAQSAGPNATGILLTRTGRDGVAGLKEMRDAGALTLAHDDLNIGTSREACRIGAVQQLFPFKALTSVISA